MRLAPALGAVLVMAVVVGVGPAAERSLLTAPHPGRLEARQRAIEATALLVANEVDEAAEMLGEAVSLDPLLAGAWANLAAAELQRCHPLAARGAAMIAQRLDPALEQAAQTYRAALGRSCPEPEARMRAAWQWIGAPGDVPAWIRGASYWRSQQRWLLAAFLEERALDEGVGDAESRWRLARDLERAGLLRSALAALEDGDPPLAEQERALADDARRRLGAIAPEAVRLAGRAALVVGWSEPTRRQGLVQLAEVLLARGLDATTAWGVLQRLLEVGQPLAVHHPWGGLELPPGWQVVQLPRGPASPLFVARRFPGDTQLSVHPLPVPDPARASDAVERAFRTPPLRLDDPLTPCAEKVDEMICLEGRGRVIFPAEGAGEVELRLLLRSGWPTGLLFVALVSDGGCGDLCRQQALEETRAVMESFRPADRPPAAVAPESSAALPQPAAWNAPRVHDEAENPWRGQRLDDDLLIEVPPGVVVAELGSVPLNFAPPAGARLWLRGSFVDQQGRSVRIGNGQWYGWIEVSADPEGEKGELQAPALDPRAVLGPPVSLARALARLRLPGTGVLRLARGEAFEGKWILFRRILAGRVVDGFLPVAEGDDSLSLLYMPLTVHSTQGGEPPPLVDLSSRYEVRFDRFRDPARRADPREGLLYAAEIQLPVPKGFRVSLNRRSSDGFPLTLRHADDGTLMRIFRWPTSGEDIGLLEARAESQAGGAPPEGWKAGRRVRDGITRRAEYPGHTGEREAPERCLVLLAPRASSRRAAYLLELIRGGQAVDAEWKTACRLAGSVRYRRETRR